MNQQQVARERAAKNVCIICEEDGGRLTRGLCIKHHTRYVTARKKIPEDRREAYDEYLVANGLLLPSRKGRRVDPDANEFAVAAGEFLAGSTPAAQRLAEEMVDRAESEQAAEEAQKKSRGAAKRKKT